MRNLRTPSVESLMPNPLRMLIAICVLCAVAGPTLAAEPNQPPKDEATGENPPVAGRRPLELQIVVDVYDDLIACHFSEKTFREMMRIFHDWGIRRVYWNGQSYASGLYDAAAEPGVDAHSLRTFQEVGEFIPIAAKLAHEQGMEFYVEFKPFDMSFPVLTPHDMSLFKVSNTKRKGIPAIGGSWQMGSTFPEQHPECLMARNMTGIRPGIERETIATIQFVKQDAQPTGITNDNLQIYVSRDNHHYRPYEKPYQFADRVEERPVMLKGVNLNHPSDQKETVRVLTLSGLAISEPYVAISTQKKTGTPDFANVYHKLVELYTAQGEPIPMTYGVPSPGAEAWYPPELREVRFPDRGFMFDMSETLAANDVAFRANDNVGYLDAPSRLLGLAKGKNPCTTTLCPACPEVRKFWLDQIQEFIDWGVDGVEFRWAAHQDTREWDAYGFNAPIVEEYRRRYGKDILREDFDKAKWHALRGEYYTLFLRQAKELLARHDKKMMVDVMPSNFADPAQPQFLNLHLDWPAWFSFADGVSFKWVPPGSDADALFRGVADRYGLPTYYNVWPHIVYKGWDAPKIGDHLRSVQTAGHRGFLLYEAYFFMRANSDGTFQIVDPMIGDVIAPAVKAMNAAALR